MKQCRKFLALGMIAAMLMATGCAPKEQPGTQTTEAEPTVAPTAAPTVAPTVTPATEPETQADKIPDTLSQEMYDQQDCILITMHYQDGTKVGPYIYLSVPQFRIGPDDYQVIEEPDLSDSPEWITFTSGDEKIEFSVFSGDPDIIRYTKNGKTSYFEACYPYAGEENPPFSLEQQFRLIFDPVNRAVNGRAAFVCDGGPEAALSQYVQTEFLANNQKLAVGSCYRFSDYDCLSYEVTESAEHWVHGKFSYAIRYERFVPAVVNWGEEQGTGDYEGWLIYKDQNVVLEKQPDGLWRTVGIQDYSVSKWPEGEDYREHQPRENAEASEYLQKLPQLLQEIRGTEENQIQRLADTFLRTSTAVALVGDTEFDWSVFCMDDWMNTMGMRSFFTKTVLWENASGYLHGRLKDPLAFQCVFEEDDHAIVYYYEITIHFMKDDAGLWKICDIEQPFAAT